MGRHPNKVIVYKEDGCEIYNSVSEASEKTGVSTIKIRRSIRFGTEYDNMIFDYLRE